MVIPVLLVLLCPGAAQARIPVAKLSVAGTIPRWSDQVGNYVSYCQDGKLEVSARRSRGAKVWVDGRLVRTGYSKRLVRLTPGQRVTMRTMFRRTSRWYSVRCLPADFPRFAISGLLPASMPLAATGSTNLGFTVAPYGFILDRRGVPVWWHRSSGNNVMDVKGLPGNRIGMWEGNLVNDHSTGDFFVYRADGKQDRVVKTTAGGGGDAHEAQLATGDNWYRIALQEHALVDLGLLGDPAHNVTDDQIQEITSNGSLRWSWSALEHITLAEQLRWYWLIKATTPAEQGLDMFHMNSVQETPDGNLIVSIRYSDAIFKIRKQDGAVLWKLGGTHTAQSLDVIGNGQYNEQTFAGQHDARLQTDGSITVYDNGSGIKGRSPRATRWVIDPVAHTARLVEQLVDSQILASAAGGSARRTSDGSWMVAWCHYPNIRAYSSTHKQLWEFKFLAPGRPYRAQPIPRGWVSAKALIAGMDAQYPRR